MTRKGTTKTAPQSGGILLFRQKEGLEVLLGHPGGPFWSRRDDGAWSVPKGLVEAGEDLLGAARRELREETGLATDDVPDEAFLPLGSVRLSSGKVVHAWALERDCDPASLACNEIEVEWPPRSGRRVRFPEVDRFAFFGLDVARSKIAEAQTPFLDRLSALLGEPRLGS